MTESWIRLTKNKTPPSREGFVFPLYSLPLSRVRDRGRQVFAVILRAAPEESHWNSVLPMGFFTFVQNDP